MNDERPSPESIYRVRAEAARMKAARLGRWDDLMGWARLAIFVVAIALAVLALRGHTILAWLLVPAIIFIALVVAHGRVIDRRGRFGAMIALCEAGLARVRDEWAGKGDSGETFRRAAEAHLYAADLDIFGTGGLFELLSVARTPIGRATLADWLQTTGSVAAIRDRQAAVAELGTLADFREEMSLVATKINEDVREEALMAWAVRAPSGLGDLLPWRAGLAAAALATAVAGVLWSCGLVGPVPAALAFVVGGVISSRIKGAVSQILAGLDRRADELQTLAGLMALVERQPFESPALRALRQALLADGLSPSRRIAQLRRLVDAVESRRNQLAGVLMGSVRAVAQLALAIESWRRVFGPAVVRWMSAVGELEALSSLATFHFEHPGFPFPTLDERSGSPRFDGEALGHPLIPAARRVANDLCLGGPLRLILVSGSNMSGKSTLLRTVGINIVLALAGAPVCARRLMLSPVALGATLRVNDSLQAGHSRFYAELTHLKRIVDRTSAEPPVLFLLDEILHGTNSHDRRIGAEAIIRSLLARGAAGLVTTHDLALAEVAAALGSSAINVHFEDSLEGGLMTFDYRMKEGVVRKSNALALMRAVGLDV